jgi:predicted DNA-binding transcriptional regulator YafY
MSIINKIERIERMHKLINFKRTGSPQHFASKMGVSQSMLYLLIKEIKELGAPVVYCRYRESYEYLYPVEFKIGFDTPSLTASEMQATYGGNAIIRPLFITRSA